jgi:hypothetical protein
MSSSSAAWAGEASVLKLVRLIGNTSGHLASHYAVEQYSEETVGLLGTKKVRQERVGNSERHTVPNSVVSWLYRNTFGFSGTDRDHVQRLSGFS